MENWSFEHFLIYVYICIAKVDSSISDEEIEIILDKIDELNLSNKYNYAEIFHDILSVYNNQNEEQQFETIFELAKKHCKQDQVSKQKLFNDLLNIIESDGQILEKEQKMFLRIKNTVDKISEKL